MLAKLTKPRVLVSVVVVLVAAFAIAYFTLFKSDSPAKFSLATKGSTNAAAPPAGDLAGTWTVADGSEAGYRVREKLAQLPAPSDAVGRTGAITGQITMTDRGGAYSAGNANFTVDVSQLKSPQAKRDNKIRTIGLETDKYPQATFAAAGPIGIPDDAVKGKAVTVPVEGDLMLHGQTRKVSIPLQVQRDGAQIKIVGSYQFLWSDFGMSAPSLLSFVSVTGNPTLEFSLLMSKQA
ncbi:MAG TPA: YceI family protein [Acidimicrobiia bacterium]|nr:YceI family protein [Acidimicrobiia bacterium]